MGFFKKIKAFFTFSNEDINDAEVVVETFLRDPKNKQLNIEDSKDFEKIKTELLSAFEKTWKHIENMPKAEKDGLSLKWLKYFKDIYALAISRMRMVREKPRLYIDGLESSELQIIFWELGFVFATLRFKPREIVNYESHTTQCFISLLKEFEAPHLKPIRPYLGRRLLEWESRIPTEETNSKNFI